MQLALARLNLTKRRPLTISRGTSATAVNFVVTVTHDGLSGSGEAAPNGVTGDTAETVPADFARWSAALAGLAPDERQAIEAALDALPTGREGIGGVGGTALRCAIETACWDWLGKRAGLPVWRLLGIDRRRMVPTSVTVGINPPEVAAEQTREWRADYGARHLKIKLGSPAGIAADQAMLEAVRAAAGEGAVLRVDANGGWSAADARVMLAWLAERGIEYVEQPLPAGQESELAALRPSPLPLYLDESIHDARDVARFAGLTDGVNLKLMKSGGIGEGLRVIHAARAHGLKVMVGCMSESSLAIASGAALAALCDCIDLDSHLNLRHDPFVGLAWDGGRVLPSEAPGLGVAPRA